MKDEGRGLFSPCENQLAVARAARRDARPDRGASSPARLSARRGPRWPRQWLPPHLGGFHDRPGQGGPSPSAFGVLAAGAVRSSRQASSAWVAFAGAAPFAVTFASRAGFGAPSSSHSSGPEPWLSPQAFTAFADAFGFWCRAWRSWRSRPCRRLGRSLLLAADFFPCTFASSSPRVT